MQRSPHPQLVYLDVGTHQGQEFRVLTRSFRRHLLIWLKFLILSLIKREIPSYSLQKLLRLRMLQKKLADQVDMYSILVEPNISHLSSHAYRQADLVLPIAITANAPSPFSIASLYIPLNNKLSQSASLYEKHLSNRSTVVTDLGVASVTADSFSVALKDYLEKHIINREYLLLLRINNEGHEDDVIYSIHRQFGSRLSCILGSLQDVRKIKGQKVYDALETYLNTHNIEFTPFDTRPSTWEQALMRIYDFVDG